MTWDMLQRINLLGIITSAKIAVESALSSPLLGSVVDVIALLAHRVMIASSHQ